MSWITLRQAASWCGGTIEERYAEVAFCGANMDSRKVAEGELFVALEGVRDGHDFIPAAMEKGAAAVLCKRCVQNIPAIVVEDPRIALGQIAAGLRQKLGMQVVGVTGSVGKSTTKEMIAAVLQGDYRVSKTPANFNNDLGMPMAILAMPEDTQVAVLEMGMNHFGEISYLTEIAQPNVAVVINVGTMHIENLGSREGILKAKLEILEGLEKNGSVMLCGDNDMLWSVRGKIDHPVVYFGAENPQCDLRAMDVAEEDGIFFRVHGGDTEFGVQLALEGRHYVADAMAAVAVGLHFGVSAERITQRLGGFQNMAGRQEIFEKNGFHIIKDCYNAGPESMAAALAVLGKRTGRRIAVLGDMLELGDHGPQAHRQVGCLAAQHADLVLAFGPLSCYVAEGAGEKCRTFHDRDTMAVVLKEMARPGDTLLFKGSHGMHMENVLERFLDT